MRKQMLIMLLAFCPLASLLANSNANSKPASHANVEQQVEALLSKMTIEEKVGQMTQITLATFMRNGKLDKAKLKEIIVDHQIGSVLNVAGLTMTAEEWQELLTQFHDEAKKTRLQIPIIYGVDAIHGASYIANSTLFPHNIGMAASRNPDLAYQSAKICAKETRASGVPWNFDLVLGAGREPLWPRFEETYGEDTYLITQMGLSTFKGYEEDGLKSNTAVASCMKHYLGYSVPHSGKDRSPAYIPERQLREYFLPPFEAAIKAGSQTIMINSGSINGIPVHANKYILTDVLKEELGFKGLVVTDWLDIIYLYSEHRIAKDNREAVKLAVNAGIDMSMVPNDLTFYNDLVDLVKDGEVSMERIDDAVGRILTVKYNLGLFENEYPEKEALKNFGQPEYKEVALQAAHESIVLLKNEKDILPLPKKAKILLAGPGANNLGTLHGSWSYVWQGNDPSRYPESTLTIKEAFEAKLGASNIICQSTTTFDTINKKDIVFVQEQAAEVDYIVLCLGEDAYAETPGNINDLMLAQDQVALAKAAIETGKPVVLVLTQGRPRIIREIEPAIPGILMAHRPASQGANAIADIIFGDYNPNGKLAYNYPKYTGNISTYDAPYRMSRFAEPQWAFGHGLSYTNFSFGKIQLSNNVLQGDDVLEISIDVKNTGKRNGQIAIDLFISDLVSSIVPPNKRLKKFTKIELAAGESKTIKFKLTKDDLSFIGQGLNRIVEAGEFKVMIAGQEASFEYQF